MDLANGECPDKVRYFCYLEDMLSGGGIDNSGSVARVDCAYAEGLDRCQGL